MALDTLPVLFDRKFECNTRFGPIYKKAQSGYCWRRVDNASEYQNNTAKKNSYKNYLSLSKL